jgi:predicted enzyme related to lactoylglutathione lyase
VRSGLRTRRACVRCDGVVAIELEETIMPHPFVHVELNSTQPAKAKAFYKKLFAWKLKDRDMGPPAGMYTMIDVGRTGTGGGIMRQMMPDTGSEWTPYVLVTDIEASTKKAEKLGGTVHKDVTEIPGMGWLSIIEDPTGAVFGLWKPKPKRRRK